MIIQALLTSDPAAIEQLPDRLYCHVTGWWFQPAEAYILPRFPGFVQVACEVCAADGTHRGQPGYNRNNPQIHVCLLTKQEIQER